MTWKRTLVDPDEPHVKTEVIALENGNIATRRSEDAEPLCDWNKALQNLDDGFTPSRDMRRVASLPLTVVEDLMKRGIWQDKKALRKWLADGDNRAFRTSLDGSSKYVQMGSILIDRAELN